MSSWDAPATKRDLTELENRLAPYDFESNLPIAPTPTQGGWSIMKVELRDAFAHTFANQGWELNQWDFGSVET